MLRPPKHDFRTIVHLQLSEVENELPFAMRVNTQQEIGNL